MINSYETLINRMNQIKEELGKLENPEKKQKEIKKIIEELNGYKDISTQVFNTLIKEMNPIKENGKIEELKAKIEALNTKKEIFTLIKNYYHGFRFDQIIYALSNPSSFEDFNDNLKLFFETFKRIGIELTINDFNYSIEVNKYLQAFLEHDDDQLKKVFDNLYWENHYILIDISINCRNLIKKHEETIKKHVVNLYNAEKLDEDVLSDEYEILVKELHQFKTFDLYLIMDKFRNKEFNINDFIIKEQDVPKFITSIITLEEYNTGEHSEFYDNIVNLKDNLFEYDCFNMFKYLLEEIKTIAEAKKEKANNLKDKDSKITKLIGEDTKLNEKLRDLIKKYNENGNEKLIKEIDEIKIKLTGVLTEIRDLYKDYDQIVFENDVINLINENSSLRSVFGIYHLHYGELANSLKTKFPEDSRGTILEKIELFDKFCNNINNKLLDNINYLQTDNISEIISARYQLFNLNVKINIEDPSYAILKNDVEKIIMYFALLKQKIKPIDIKIILENTILE